MARGQPALEPWREVAHCQLMQALVLADDRTAALAQFDICCDVLADELGVPPAHEKPWHPAALPPNSAIMVFLASAYARLLVDG